MNDIGTLIHQNRCYYELLWRFLHSLTWIFSENPTTDERRLFYIMFDNVKHYIECPKCIEHWEVHIKNINTTSRRELVEWLFNVHNSINKQQNKQIKQKKEFLNEYSNDTIQTWLLKEYGINMKDVNFHATMKHIKTYKAF